MVLDHELALENVRPLRRSEYGRMVSGGIIPEDEKIELLEGILVNMSPEGPVHAEVVSRLAELFVMALAGRARVRTANPFAASDESEPEPDIALVPPGDYWSDHPMKTFLLVEVAGSSVRKDRGIKRRIYARAGVPEYWVVNLQTRAVEVHSSPAGDDYQKIERFEAPGTLRPAAFPDIEVPLASLFPPEAGSNLTTGG